MTTVYFVRHSKPDHAVQDDAARPLNAEGMRNRWIVADYLADKGIEAVLSSPYKRTVDTVVELAEKNGLEIEKIHDFRERKPANEWIPDDVFLGFVEKQWADFDYSYGDGESLREVQQRNIAALDDVLWRYEGKTIAIGTHGTALSTIINYYEPKYSQSDFMAMIKLTPWIVRMDFQGAEFRGIEKINVLELYKIPFDNTVK